MKVIIPVAGYATRLHPITLDKPKALLDVQGKPIIEHIIKKIEEIENVDHIYIITNNKFFKDFDNWLKNFSCSIPMKLLNDNTTSNEDRKGQIGDIHEVIEKENIDDELLVVSGDNLFNFSLKHIHGFCKEKNVFVNGLYDAKSLKVAQEQGNASVDENGKMVSFEEKPEKPKSTYISLGIYYCPKEKVELYSKYLEEGNNPDKMGYFMTWLLNREGAHGYVYEDKWFDIGWQESLEQARKEFKP